MRALAAARSAVLTAFALACVLFAGAALLGWLLHRAHPQGMLLFTPTGPCPPLEHAFGIGFTLGAIAAGIGCAVASFMGFTAAAVTNREAVKRSCRRYAWMALLVVPILSALRLAQPLLESLLPRQAVPGCSVAR